MRRSTITFVFIGLAALLVLEGFLVFQFLQNVADATKLVAMERQVAHEASGITRRIMAEGSANTEGVPQATSSTWLKPSGAPGRGVRQPASHAVVPTEAR